MTKALIIIYDEGLYIDGGHQHATQAITTNE